MDSQPPIPEFSGKGRNSGVNKVALVFGAIFLPVALFTGAIEFAFAFPAAMKNAPDWSLVPMIAGSVVAGLACLVYLLRTLTQKVVTGMCYFLAMSAFLFMYLFCYGCALHGECL